jgi:OOP family OmpA-OmpF porin
MDQLPPDADRTADRTAVIVDVTDSTRGSGSAVRSPDYAALLRPSVEAAVQSRGLVAIGSFSGTGVTLKSVKSVDWRKDNENEDNQKARQADATTCLLAELQAAAALPAESSGTDILRAIATAADWVGQSPRGKRLVVGTDGLITTGCADLRKAGFTDSEINAIIHVCVKKNEIRRRELDGVATTLLGIGHPAGDQPVPTQAQLQWLQRMWGRFCAVAGADPACAQQTGFVQSTTVNNGGKHKRDPIVAFTNGTKVTYSMPGVALFDSASPILRHAARPVLERIAVEVRTSHNAWVKVNGYVDPRGSPKNNKSLSQKRANAVWRVLNEYGVTKGRAEGKGVAKSCPYEASKQADEDARLQCYRRVDIIVTKQ